jgi:O-antigen ligase
VRGSRRAAARWVRRPVFAIVAVAAVVLLAGVATAWATQAAHGQGHPAAAGGFWHGRLHTWQAAIETFADRPIAGSGSDSFLAASILHQRFFPVRFAHDLPLELAAELGVIGFVLAVGLYATCGLALWRSRTRARFWLLGPAAVAFLIANLLDWPWHLAGSGAVWAAAFGACCLSIRLPPPRNRDDSIS